jgi:hypothetical protein
MRIEAALFARPRTAELGQRDVAPISLSRRLETIATSAPCPRG